MQNQDNKAIEMVIFKTKTPFSDEQVVEALSSIDPVLQTYEGFISRQISKNMDGHWMDLVYWENLELAHKAAAQVMKDDKAAGAFSVIDENSMQMYHFVPVQPILRRRKKG